MTATSWSRHCVLGLSMCLITLLSVYVSPGWSQLPPWNDNQSTQNQSNAMAPAHAGSVPTTTFQNGAIASASVASAGSAVMSSVILANGSQQLAIFDQAKQTIVVYHIEPGSGDIRLKSVRRVDYDFSLEEFNLTEPTPSTVRKNIGRN